MKIEITIPVDSINGQPMFNQAVTQLEALAALFRGGAAAIANFNPTIGGTPGMNNPNSGAAGSGDNSDDDNGPQDTTAPNVDASGLPWDARIHSANKSRTKEGMWRNKRGTTAGEIASVEAQLRQQAGQNSGMYMQPGGQQMQQQPQVTGVMNPQPGQQQMQMPQGQPPQQYQQQPNGMPQPMGQQQPMPMGGQHMQMPQGQPPQQYQQQPPIQQMQQQQPVGQLDAQGFMTHLSNQMQAKMQDGVTPMIEQNYLANALPRINQLLAQNGMPPMNAITDVLSNPAAIPFAVMILQGDGRW